MEKIVKNFEKMLGRDNLFIPATDEQIQKLEELFGDKVGKVIDFYRKYQPYDLPMLDSYVSLLDIESIFREKEDLEPGCYLAEYGVFVIAVTVGGNVVCLDTNDVTDGDAAILISNLDFCMYDDEKDIVEAVDIPDDVYDDYSGNGPILLNYDIIKRSLPKIADSFYEFMLKLSKNEYDDIEELLPEYD